MRVFQKLYYKRSQDKPILFSGDEDNLVEGDSLRFYGKLYIDENLQQEVADTEIEYQIVHIRDDKTVLMNTSNEYTFNKLGNVLPTGTILFEGRIVSPNFQLNDDTVQPYTTVPAVLSLFDSSHNYKYSYGMSNFEMVGDGIGHVLIDINIL